jgi:hypothetical protein
MVLATSGYNYFNLFLKSIKNSDGSSRWSREQVNLIPIGGSAINVVFGMSTVYSRYFAILTIGLVWVWALLSDALRTRWLLIVAQGKSHLLQYAKTSD